MTESAQRQQGDGPRVGLSSGCAPHLGAAALARLIRDEGGSAVDLALGKGQAWEEAGVDRGLGILADAGVTIEFVSIGRLADPRKATRDLMAVPSDVPVKVAVAGSTGPQARRWLEDWRDLGHQVLVETYAGEGTPELLLELADAGLARLVFDNRGWHALTGGYRDPASLAPYIAACQLKGFDPSTPDLRHRRLGDAELGQLARLLGSGARPGALLLESKATAAMRADLDDLVRIAEVAARTTGVRP